MLAPDSTLAGLSGIARRIGRAYSLGLGLIGALSIAAFLALNGFIIDQGEGATVINVAGMQRMLSQRIVGLAQTLSDGTGTATQLRDRVLLRTAVDELHAAHEGLMAGDAERRLPGIRSGQEYALYAEAPHRVDARVRSFVRDAHAVLAGNDPRQRAAIVARMADAARSELLDALDAVVVLHEGRARRDARRAETLHRVLLIVILSVLLLEARFVFAPLAAELRERETALRRQQAELVYRSSHDQLTGLFNRHHLHESKAQLAQRAPTAPVGGYSLIALDLDNFKQVNDERGHAAGDRVLCIVATRIRANIGEYDMPFRLGGDEFLIVIESGGPGRARRIAERLRADLRQAMQEEPGCAMVAASIGVASAPADGSCFERVHGNADIALYHTKSIGKDAVSVFHETLRSEQAARLSGPACQDDVPRRAA